MKKTWGVSGNHGFLGASMSKYLGQLGESVVRIERTGFYTKVDYVVDFGAYGNMYGQTDPIAIYIANVVRVIEILRWAKKYEVKKVILTSTSSVKLPVQTYYSASKKAMEEVAKIFAKENGINLTIIRPSSVYGVGEQKEHLIPKLIDSCLNGTEMPFVESPTHDFIYIDDFVEAVYDIATLKTDKVVTYNIGSGYLYSNEQIKNFVEDITGKKANLKIEKTLRKYDTNSWPKASWIWGKVSIREGLERMINEARK